MLFPAVTKSKSVITNFKMVADACTKTNSLSYTNGIKAFLILTIFYGHCMITGLGFPNKNGKFIEDLKNSLFCNCYTVIFVLFENYFIIGGMFTYKTLEKECSRR